MSAGTKPKIGQEVYVVNHRRGMNSGWRTVEHVGRKYFWTGGKNWRNQFAIETWRATGSTVHDTAYESKEQYLLVLERQRWERIFRETFTSYRLNGLEISLEQYRQAAEILGINYEQH